MKQYISVEQLQELTEKQSDNLALWFANRNMLMEPLSIGQCIELLGKNVSIHNILFPSGWAVQMPNRKMFIQAEELIDALWEAAKEVL